MKILDQGTIAFWTVFQLLVSGPKVALAALVAMCAYNLYAQHCNKKGCS